MGIIKDVSKQVVSIMKQEIEEAHEEYKEEQEREKAEQAKKEKETSNKNDNTQDTTRSTELTQVQLAQQRLNQELLLLNIAKYFCEALPALSSGYRIATDVRPENLDIKFIRKKCYVNLFFNTDKRLSETDLQTIRRDLNRTFRNIYLQKQMELNGLEVQHQRELSAIQNYYEMPTSYRYGNWNLYLTDLQQINYYYSERKKEYSIYQRQLKVIAIHKVENGIRLELSYED